MKVVLQRVSKASVSVDGNEVGVINRGLLLLIGIHHNDSKEKMIWMCNKILKLRVFNDENGKMNKSVLDIMGGLLVVPQFTLYGDIESGNRPSYIEAAGHEKAKELYHKTITYLRKNSPLTIRTGKFGAHMNVQLNNDGPVTLVIDR